MPFIMTSMTITSKKPSSTKASFVTIWKILSIFMKSYLVKSSRSPSISQMTSSSNFARFALMNFSISSTFFLILSFSFTVHAQDAPLQAEEDTVEIIVTGKSRFNLRELAMEKEEAVYDIFNSLVDDKQFKITCKWENRYLSHIKSWGCMPEFERVAEQAKAQGVLGEMASVLGSPGAMNAGSVAESLYLPPDFAIQKGQAEMKEKMRQVANESPEFVDALIQYVEAKENYKETFK